MWGILFRVVMLTSLAVHSLQAAELERAASRWDGTPSAAAAAAQAPPSDPPSERSQDAVTSKGVLERSLRLRSRLNTHIMMLRFKM
ncbi:hypothetical protein [Paenibacillus sp.]|uniref:hypothetical protein n=1 Tax=Paenibacillus sp. TaxID=58172 RepID=UPI002D702F83|nr:hypothetical protein [Paenibacillus sp.]HZG86191.1 hypothetical protein [Paenibacillus sp.]